MKIVVIGGGAAGIGAAGAAKGVEPDRPRSSSTPSSRTPRTARAASPSCTARRSSPSSGCSSPPRSSTSSRVSTSTTRRRSPRSTPTAKTVDVAGEGEVPYDRLIVATGFDYADPGVPGSDLGGLYQVKNIRRAMEWDKVLDTVKAAVVVEAAPLGMEMVTALRHRGIEHPPRRPGPVGRWPIATDPDIVEPVRRTGRRWASTCTCNNGGRLPAGDGTVTARRDLRGRDRRPTWPSSAPTRWRTTELAAAAGIKTRLDRRHHRRRADADVHRGRLGCGRLHRDPARRVQRAACRACRAATRTRRARRPGRTPAAASAHYQPGLRAVGHGRRGVDARRRVVRRDAGRPRSASRLRHGRRAGHLPGPLLPGGQADHASSCSPTGATRRLIGAQMVGGEGIKERADFLAMMTRPASRSTSSPRWRTSTRPPIGALNEPIALAAQNAARAKF